MGRRAALIALAAVCSCNDAPPAWSDAGGAFFSPTQAAPKPPPARHVPDAGSPLDSVDLPTTDGTIATDNLIGEIEMKDKMLARDPHNRVVLPSQVALEQTRAQLFGRLDGYERALALADRLVADDPKDPNAYLARAQARSSVHRFPEALADAAKAEKLPRANTDRIADLRATVLLATGKGEEALKIRAQRAAAAPDLSTLAAVAVAESELGRTDEAERHFVEAQRHYRNVSPFPVAALWFQEGVMWERAGRLARAEELYRAAIERLPRYAPARGHFAGVIAARGDRDAAIGILMALVNDADDPEYLGQLAELERQTGRAADGDAHAARGKRRYEELLGRQRAAFADHAARFFLGAGGDPKRALGLARENEKARDTAAARQLVLEAQLAVGDAKGACQAADRALARCADRCVAHARVLAARAYQGCGQAARAEKELAAAGGAPAQPAHDGGAR